MTTADMMMVASREGVRRGQRPCRDSTARPDLHPATNEQIVARMQQQGFTYFRQISTVLSTITMLFGFLLITVLLTVSVNQRLGEIAALRALGFSRTRVAADVLCQSALLVGTGGVLALPLGVALSIWLDRDPEDDARHSDRAAFLRLRTARARLCTPRCSS